jgi:hypothetical protein
MTPPELVTTLTAIVATKPRLRVLAADAADAATAAVAAAFISDPSRRWWWESVNTRSKSFEYDADGLAILDAIMSNVGEPLLLFATDDESPPWMVISGPWQDLRSLVAETQFFEFLLVDAALSWIVFDTHHNRLLIAGDHPALEGADGPLGPDRQG